MPSPDVCPGCHQGIDICRCELRDQRAIFILHIPLHMEDLTLEQIEHQLWSYAPDLIEEIAKTIHRYFYDQPAEKRVVKNIIRTLQQRLQR